MNPSRGKRPERIGALVRERIAALGWESRLREEEVLIGWDAAVGPQIAAHARPSHIANRRLTIVTESPVWTQQLSMLKPELLRRIAGSFGPGTVTELFFVTGKIEPPPRGPAPAAERRPAPAALPPAIESELAGISDAEVREAVRSLMIAALADVDPPARSAEPG
jgi:predicted nucleic acid-binding Zn ribbon protein